VLLAVALFAPTSDNQSAMVHWLSGILRHLGAKDAFVRFNRLEVVMNAVIVAPASFLATLAWPRSTWRDWTAIGFAASLTVELVQGLALPGRQAAFSDVVANTAGALLGAVVLHLARRLAGRPDNATSFFSPMRSPKVRRIRVR